MLINLAPPSKNAGNWQRVQVGTRLTGIRVNYIAFESAEEIRQCVQHPEWFYELSHNFYPSNPFRPIREEEKELPVRLEYRDDMNK